MVRQVRQPSTKTPSQGPGPAIKYGGDRYNTDSTELKAAKLVVGSKLNYNQQRVIQHGELVYAPKLDDIRADSTRLTISKKTRSQEKTFKIELTAINARTAHFKIKEPGSSWSQDCTISLQEPETGKPLPEIAAYIHKLLPKLAENQTRKINAAPSK
ncbi:MAG: hypothetical protein O3C63_05075 [Cyanobacteria bacterium]|nr:hypothetical protein [Cyanobacteriota bacterium]MDA1020470.1 hypothetical protein [Cyanobacteriota bacterium]